MVSLLRVNSTMSVLVIPLLGGTLVLKKSFCYNLNETRSILTKADRREVDGVWNG